MELPKVISWPADTKPTFYECEICGAWHSALWNGDCRQDDARFYPNDLDQAFGPFEWDSIDMKDVDEFQSRAT